MKNNILTIIALVAVFNACNRADIVPDGSMQDGKAFSVHVDAPLSVKSESVVRRCEMQVNADVKPNFSVSLTESSRPVPVGVSTKVFLGDVVADTLSFRNMYGYEGFMLYSIDSETASINSLGTMYYNKNKEGWLLSDPARNPRSYDEHIWYAGLVPNDTNVIRIGEYGSFEIHCTPDVDAQENIMVGLNYAYHHEEDYYCLHFMHVTSLIHFKFFADDSYASATLKEIGLYNINSEGDILMMDRAGKWTPVCLVASVPQDYVLTLSDEKPLDYQGIFVVPTQAYGDTGMDNAYIAAKIEVSGPDGPVVVNARASLAGVSWNPGYIYDYTVKLRDLVTPDGSTEDYTDGSSYGNDLFN